MVRVDCQSNPLGRGIVAVIVAAMSACPGVAQSVSSMGTASSQAPSTPQKPVVLDSVIAVINGDVLLRSDLQSEMEMAALQPLSLPEGKNFERRAAQRLVNRTLILQQMRMQGMVKDVTDEDVRKDLDLLRKQLPVCVKYHCETTAGWTNFLADHNLTTSEVTARWKQRMQILAFVDTRFRAGIRISKTDISDYYTKTLTPQFQAQHVNPPAMASISGRIEEVLLQQHVNSLLQDWLKSLRDQGNVIVLDPALGPSNPGPDAGDDGEGA